MLSKFFRKSSGKGKTEKSAISYDEAKSLAKDSEEDVRMELAARRDLAPELLYFLAEDPSPKVRQNVAANTAAPRHADMLLVTDTDTKVRESLAGKLARLAPGLSADEQDKLRKMAYEALSLLAKDQAVNVREVLSDALKEVADAPPDVIRRLAWDVEAAVASPVLRFSPVLSDQDLLEIISARPSAGAASAISERASVSENVSDAIISSNDENAIGLLLGNHSAMIREQALDRIIDRAVDVDIWHEPLAMRPKLPSSAAVKIARFVAEDILTKMVERSDLSPDIVASVRDVVNKRLGDAHAVKGAESEGKKKPAVAKGVNVDDDEVFDQASKMWAKGKIDESTVMTTIDEGNRRLAQAMIAVMIDFPLKTVVKTCEMKSAKGCAALAWKAGLSAKNAEIVQRKLAFISETDLLRADGEDYAFSDEDMEWQLDFMQGL
ncbi:DUF2336 domain-containing protein [Rhodospirillales bacterium]|nr:DUF2336 domain-containing protein [Rhodospirillales bacterium]